MKSWKHDPRAFIYEFIGTLFTIIASMMLVINAKDPNMVVIFPLYEIGTISLWLAYRRKEAVWSVVLTSYFLVVNFIGFIIALG